ncbi:MAG: 1-deoxy-D-xylulose-5-phosphate reductoisomerase [SAR202 cluster bacterium]|nr:1-deoxy-D-xylulose-5-phosphate reductoisomerase [SAR202 cluster bacterium]
MKGVVILGSTGSIGTQTLDVVRALPGNFRVLGLAANNNTALMERQVAEFRPAMVWVGSTPDGVPPFDRHGATVVPMDAMACAPGVDVVMLATTGRAGLAPALTALRQGTAVALSSKEVIVMAGGLVMEAAKAHGAPVLAVDSEPSAIWQCLRGEALPPKRLIITASGGPFRKRPIDELDGVTAREALAHPTWVMGKKITIDSATLMNKGFEVIESHWLFDMPYDRIDVVVHPQSVIHSMVEFADGSVKAQLGPPDMRLPIQHALSYPERLPSAAVPTYDPLRYPALTFEPLDPARYPCFATAREAGARGGTYPSVLSAADEEAVRLFLQGRIRFTDIHRLVASALDAHEPSHESLETVLEADAWARRHVAAAIDGS